MSIRPERPLRLHRFALSGHCHRVELLLSLLNLPHELVDVDLARGEHKAPPFLALNPLGQVPVLCDGDTVLSDSNAILAYLALRYAPDTWWPADPQGMAAVQRWLSIAAGPLAQGPAALRMAVLFGIEVPLAQATKSAQWLLSTMEVHLRGSRFLAGPQPTLADVANYAYVARAPEGNLDLGAWPEVRAWLARVEALPGFVAMPRWSAGTAR